MDSLSLPASQAASVTGRAMDISCSPSPLARLGSPATLPRSRFSKWIAARAGG